VRNQLIDAIKRQQDPYSFSLGPDGESLSLNGTIAYQYTANYSPCLYYFEHPLLPYMFTLSCWDPPDRIDTWREFYEVLGSFTFAND
jgi:hypothetical protein